MSNATEVGMQLQNPEAAIQRIATFAGIPASPADIKLAVYQCSLQHMAQHATKYDEHMLKARRNVACGLHERAGLDGSNQVCQHPAQARTVMLCGVLIRC